MFIVIGFLLFLVLSLNLQFTPWPEMLLWPYLINHGWLPYRDIAIAHSPFLVLALSQFFHLFSVSVASLKIFSWALILGNSLVLYFVSRKLFPQVNSGLVFLAYLFLAFRYEGNGVWFDQALVVPIVLVYFFLRQKKYFLSGLMFGIALGVKQTAGWFGFPILMLLFGPAFLHNAIQFIKGFLCVLILWWGTMILMGIFPDYWRWSIQFGLGVLPGMPGSPSLLQLFSALLPFLVFLLLPLATPAYRKPFLVLFVWSAFGALGIFPRFGLFHLQPALPFLSLSLVSISNHISKKYHIFYWLVILVLVSSSFRYFFRAWHAPDRFMEPEFLAAVEQAKNSSGTMFNFNWWDSAYVLANKFPPRPWVPQLPWYLSQPQIKEQLLESLSLTPPETVIYYPGGDPALLHFLQSSYSSPPANCTLGCTIGRESHLSN